MEEKIITFEIAKLLKEKNIVLDYFYHYNKNGVLIENSINNRQHVCTHNLFANNTDFELNRWGGGTIDSLCAPTQSLLQKWLRDIHGIDIMVKTWTGDIKGEKTYASDVYLFGTIIYIKLERVKTYEEALEKGLFEAIKLI